VFENFDAAFLVFGIEFDGNEFFGEIGLYIGF
jgi:hypothetical protein